jgi:hypothetical protein
MILLGSVSVGTQDLDILWMLSNLPKLEVSLLPKIRLEQVVSFTKYSGHDTVYMYACILVFENQVMCIQFSIDE